MASHSAKSLFDKNIQSAYECIALYEGVQQLGSTLDIAWLLRASIVFSVSALDAYFHDKLKYGAARCNTNDMPPELAKFKIPLCELVNWESSKRKGNVLRNWLEQHFSYKPLQRKDDISDAMKLIGIYDLWLTIEPNDKKREELLKKFSDYVKRRNQIAHEGDRESSRRSGKKLRKIDYRYTHNCFIFAMDLVEKIEFAFPSK